MLNNAKLQKMQDEMSRFEEEIGLPLNAPRVISANTYNEAKKQLAGHPSDRIPPPPAPPFVPAQVRPASSYSVGSSYGKSSQSVLSAPPMIFVPNPQEIAALHLESSHRIHPPSAADVQVLPAMVDEPKKPLIVRRGKHAGEIVYPQSKQKKEKKNRKIIRTAGGQTWEDNTLAEWEDDDFRLFCGDLGNDVTDEVLTRAFSKYPSFLKARVVRDKRTNKTKGFGFVSFKDPNDFIRATKEMNGRYVGSRPIKLRKSSWKNRTLDVVRKKDKEKAALISMLTGK